MVRILEVSYSPRLNHMRPNVPHRSAAPDTSCHPDTPPHRDDCIPILLLDADTMGNRMIQVWCRSDVYSGGINRG